MRWLRGVLGITKGDPGMVEQAACLMRRRRWCLIWHEVAGLLLVLPAPQTRQAGWGMLRIFPHPSHVGKP